MAPNQPPAPNSWYLGNNPRNHTMYRDLEDDTLATSTQNQMNMQLVAANGFVNPIYQIQNHSNLQFTATNAFFNPTYQMQSNTNMQQMAESAYYNPYLYTDEDPGMQLMAELNNAAPSPTLQAQQTPTTNNQIGQNAAMTWPGHINQTVTYDAPEYGSGIAPDHITSFKTFEDERSKSENRLVHDPVLETQIDELMNFENDDKDERMNGMDPEDQVDAAYGQDTSTTDNAHDFEREVQDDDSSADGGDEDSGEGQYEAQHQYQHEHEKEYEHGFEHAFQPEHEAENASEHGDEQEDEQEHEMTDHDSVDEETSENAATVQDEVDAESITGAGSQEAHDSAHESSDGTDIEGQRYSTKPFVTVNQNVIGKQDQKLHDLASKLIPHFVPEHRYWIAVLMHHIQPNKAKHEKDFIWMKGSRINTVETVWNKYRDVTTENRFQILCCGESTDFEETMEELDKFNDKLVVFRANIIRPQEIIKID